MKIMKCNLLNIPGATTGDREQLIDEKVSEDELDLEGVILSCEQALKTGNISDTKPLNAWTDTPETHGMLSKSIAPI